MQSQRDVSRPDPAVVVTLPRTAGQRPPGHQPGARPPRAHRSRLAQPLLTALGAFTLLTGGAFVAAAASAADSGQPLDWTRVDWRAVGSHYQSCLGEQQGLGAMGCFLKPVARPAQAAPVAQGSQRSQPFYSTVVIQDATPAPPARRPTPVPARPAAAPARSAVPMPQPSIRTTASPRPRPSATPGATPTPWDE